MAEIIKRAVQRIMRDDSGALAYTLIDLQTMQPVTDPTGYKIINQFDQHVEEVTDVKQPDAPKSEKAQERQSFNDRIKQDEKQAKKDDGSHGKDRGNYTSSGPGWTGNSDKPTRAQQTIKSAYNGGSSVRATPSAAKATETFAGVEGSTKNATAPAARQSTVATGPVNQSVNAEQPSPNRSGVKIDYSSIGANRPNKVSKQHEDFLKDVAGDVLGPGSTVSITSGDVNPDQKGWTADKGKYSKSHRHTDEFGADVQFKDAQGNPVTDPRQLADIQMAAAARNPTVGVGYGLGYMGNETVHIDQANKGGIWGGGLTADQQKNVNFARQTGIGPTPQSIDFNNMATGNVDDVTVAEAKIDQTKQGIANFDPNKTQFTREEMESWTPAQAAYHGYKAPSAETKAQAAVAMAGELSGQVIEAALAGDVKANQEVGSFMSVLENRGNSVMHATVPEAIHAPSQFSAFNSKYLDRTNANFAARQKQVTQLVDNFYAGTPAMKPNTFDLNHYYNPSLVTPEWSAGLKSSTMMIDHRFGTLDNYKASPAWRDSWKADVAKQFDYSGSSFANKPGTSQNLDSPIEKSGARGGLANMPGGSNYGGRHVGGAGSSPSSFAGGKAGPSAHSSERERDHSLDGKSYSGNSGSDRSSSSPGGSSASRGSSANNARSDTPSSGRSNGGLGSSGSSSSSSRSDNAHTRSDTKDHSSGGHAAD
jgi:hypothetical protein